MASSDLPLLALLHGAWHQASSFDKLRPLLEEQGFEVICPAFISSNKTKQNPQATHLDDIAVVNEILLPLFDQGREVVLVGHSYGGIPAVGIAQGQSIEDRATLGKKGGVCAIVFLSAVILPQGGNLPPIAERDFISIEGDWAIANDGAREVFYNGLPESEVDEMMSQLVPFSLACIKTPIDYSAGDLKIPMTYVLAELDQALVPPFQEAFAAGAPDVKMIRIQTGHSSMLAIPKEISEIIVQVAA